MNYNMCAKRTKTIGFLGKYRTRVGQRLRGYLMKIETAKRESTCPNCGNNVKRKSRGIWLCKKCGLEFTGGAHSVREVKVKEEVSEKI